MDERWRAPETSVRLRICGRTNWRRQYHYSDVLATSRRVGDFHIVLIHTKYNKKKKDTQIFKPQEESKDPKVDEAMEVR